VSALHAEELIGMTGETSPIELWEHPLSPYAQKVKIALMEKGVPFSSKTPEAIGSGSTAEEFRKNSFRGEVPVLIIEGHAIADSTIILEFLEERFPQPQLLPTDPFERARARMIEEVCDTHFEAINWGLGEIVHFKRATGELADTLRTRAAEQLGRMHGWLERELAEPEWFGGEQFGCCPRLRRIRQLPRLLKQSFGSLAYSRNDNNNARPIAIPPIDFMHGVQEIRTRTQYRTAEFQYNDLLRNGLCLAGSGALGR